MPVLLCRPGLAGTVLALCALLSGAGAEAAFQERVVARLPAHLVAMLQR